jgi:hypothetical protein
VSGKLVWTEDMLARIAELEAENARLKQENAGLEHTVICGNEILEDVRHGRETARSHLRDAVRERNEARAACAEKDEALKLFNRAVFSNGTDACSGAVGCWCAVHKGTAGSELLAELKTLREDWHRKCDALCSLEARLEKAEARVWEDPSLQGQPQTLPKLQAQLEPMRAALEGILKELGPMCCEPDGELCHLCRINRATQAALKDPEGSGT